jgi:hypothetical protein
MVSCRAVFYLFLWTSAIIGAKDIKAVKTVVCKMFVNMLIPRVEDLVTFDFVASTLIGHIIDCVSGCSIQESVQRSHSLNTRSALSYYPHHLHFLPCLS